MYARWLSVGKSGQRDGACHSMMLNMTMLQFSLTGSLVQLLISSGVFAEMAVKPAI